MRRALLLLAAMPLLIGAAYEWGGPAARGVRSLKARRYDEALAALHEGRKDLPHSAALRYDEALALEGLGRAGEAKEAYESALLQRGERGRADAAFNLGSRAMAGKDYARAIQWYRESLRVNPSDGGTKRALEEAIRRSREAPPPKTSGGGAGQRGAPPPAGSRGAAPPEAGAAKNPPPPPGQGGPSGFSRDEAEHWLDALEAERRAGRQEERHGASGSSGERDW